jgi:hypothetical protein
VDIYVEILEYFRYPALPGELICGIEEEKRLLDTMNLSMVCRLFRRIMLTSIFRHLHKNHFRISEGGGEAFVSAILSQDRDAIACAALVNGLRTWRFSRYSGWCVRAIPLFPNLHYLELRGVYLDLDLIDVLCNLKTVWYLEIACDFTAALPSLPPDHHRFPLKVTNFSYSPLHKKSDVHTGRVLRFLRHILNHTETQITRLTRWKCDSWSATKEFFNLLGNENSLEELELRCSRSLSFLWKHLSRCCRLKILSILHPDMRTIPQFLPRLSLPDLVAFTGSPEMLHLIPISPKLISVDLRSCLAVSEPPVHSPCASDFDALREISPQLEYLAIPVQFYFLAPFNEILVSTKELYLSYNLLHYSLKIDVLSSLSPKEVRIDICQCQPFYNVSVFCRY